LALLSMSCHGAEKTTILVLGDSLSSGYGLDGGASWVDHLARDFAARGAPVDFVNDSISGDTTAGGRARLPDALRRIRREDFVPAEHRHLAFADAQIPLCDGAGAADAAAERPVMLEPKVTARMLEALNLGRGERALLIGAGSGYTAALLAALAAHVTAVDIDPAMLSMARRNLAAAGIDNVELAEGDAHAGWRGPPGQPEQFDAIFISGSLPAVDDSWADALADGGRLVGIEGHAPAMRAVLLTKAGDGMSVRRESLFETVAPRLRGARERQTFQF